MRTARLAQILEMKHSLKISEATSPRQIVDDAKKEITFAYKYHFSEDAKDPVLQLVATQFNEPWTKKLVSAMTELVANLDEYDLAEIFQRTNSILGAIAEYKRDPDKKVRNFIHDAIKISRESHKNYREQVKSKFETALRRVSGLLEKAASKLKAFLPEDVPLAGGLMEQQRRELSKEKIRTFMVTPIAKSYGLDNIEMMTKILQDPSLRQKLTTIINAIDRGHKPIDGPDIAREVAELAALADQRKTNTPYFEFGQEPLTEMSEEEIAQMKALKDKRIADEKDEGDISAQEEKRLSLLRQRQNDVLLQKVIDKDRERHVRSEGVVKLLDKLLLKGTYENS